MINNVNLKEIMMIFINSVDLINPILKHHHRRTAVIAYNLGMTMDLPPERLSNLVLAASLHDIGALTIKDVAMLKLLDVEDPEPHSKMGQAMLASFKPFEDISKIIRHHHAVYDESLDVPLESHILHLADRIDILTGEEKLSLNCKHRVMQAVADMKGSTFHPEVVEAFFMVGEKEYFWFEIDDLAMLDLLDRMDFQRFDIKKNRESLEGLVLTFSRVIDFKSPFTAAHSARVAHVACRLAQAMAMTDEVCWNIKLAAYLHDLGKIAVPSEIIAKKGALTLEEFNRMKSHPYYTYRILKHVSGFEELAEWAGSHHEKKDSSGYPRKPKASEMTVEVELIAYADIFSALSEDRPYRKTLPLEEVMAIIDNEFKEIVGNRVYPVLVVLAEDLYNEIQAIKENTELEYSSIYE